MALPLRQCPRCEKPEARPTGAETVMLQGLLPLRTARYECQACFQGFKIISGASSALWGAIALLFAAVGIGAELGWVPVARGQEDVVAFILLAQAVAIGIYRGLRAHTVASAPVIEPRPPAAA